ncbi:MAG: UDP-2,4-diacetamido-2,4,6-trideoxy-beta-L-altropyranose hydrolase [Bacteriovorax sp.]|nr:UDP-2,4-diacetamido-2,4,6-trideoxy-beta-L-altropyranose hydrolase [Bacteriovorax sp.]
MKKIVFRVDSGNHIGIGHTMRCLTLAQELKKNNYQIHFITKNHAGFVQKQIADNFPISILEGGVQRTLSPEESLNYENWLGQTIDDDLSATNKCLNEIGGTDLFVIDHYSLNASYEEKIRAQKIMVIDDLMNRSHSCDLLLDQNITAQKELYTKLMTKSEALYFMGPRYALLREEFQALRAQVDQDNFNRPTKNILVFFGGADSEGNTLKLARALDEEVFRKYNFTFILNSQHADFKLLSEIKINHSKIKLISFVENFGKLMGDTDLFIGAGGTTSWERACLGVASALVAVAENQMGNCLELKKTNNIYYLGSSKTLTRDSWNTFFSEIVPDETQWYRFRQNSFQLVDGLGAKRVADSIKQVLTC